MDALCNRKHVFKLALDCPLDGGVGGVCPRYCCEGLYSFGARELSVDMGHWFVAVTRLTSARSKATMIGDPKTIESWLVRLIEAGRSNIACGSDRIIDISPMQNVLLNKYDLPTAVGRRRPTDWLQYAYLH